MSLFKKIIIFKLDRIKGTKVIFSLNIVIKTFLYLSFFPLFISSCDPVKGGDFDFTLSTKKAILVDADAYSCNAKVNAGSSDLTAIYYQIPTITINWTRSETLTIHWISLKIQSGSISGGTYECLLGGEDLLYTWYNIVGIPTSVALTSSSTLTNGCPLKCGGITMVDKKRDASGSGTVSIYGTYESGDETIPVTAKQYFNFQFKASN